MRNVNPKLNENDNLTGHRTVQLVWPILLIS